MSAERIIIDSSLFGPVPGEEPDVQMTSIVIRCTRSDQADLAALALARAAMRFQYVDENGHEMLDQDEMDANDELPAPLQTPNFTSPVIRTPDGPKVFIDFKGPLTSDMKPTLTQIVIDELAFTGVQDATLMSVFPSDRSELPWFEVADDTQSEQRIKVAFSLFWPVDENSRRSTEINVTVASNRPDLAAAALTRAAQRFARVTPRGVEIVPESGNLVDGGFDHVSQVYRTPLGPYISMDRGTYLPTPMGQALVAILREELRAEGIQEAELSSGYTNGRTEPWTDSLPQE